MKIGGRDFKTEEHCYVCGILNVTPDSFSDGGKYNTLDQALFHTEEMIRDGADLIDIGGESTRPGYTDVAEDEETARVAPVISAIKERFDIPLSIDTFRASVAEEALKAGADMVNDIWGLKMDMKMGEVISRYEVPCCLMHNRPEAKYYHFMKDMLNDLQETVVLAMRNGIRQNQIILDPGIGFGKSYENNLEALNNLEKIKELGYPVLLGASRKSVIGLTLDLPAGEREEGTLATTVIAVMKGCSFVRVHNVKANKRAILMAESILKESRQTQ